MKKKILSLLLVLSVLFSMVPLGSISASAAVNVTTNKYYTIKNVGGNRYLNVYCNSSRNNTNITLWGWDGTSGEDFKFVKNGSGYLLIPRCSTSRAVNIYGNTAKSGSNVCTWSTTKHSTQTWIPEYVASKKGYILRSAYNKNLVLTAAGNRNGSNVCVKNYNGSSYQIWTSAALSNPAPKKDTGSTASSSVKKVNYLQWDSRWGNYYYGSSYSSNITNSGCGILSIVNAVYNLNGKFIQPTDLAAWANRSGYYNSGYGYGSGQPIVEAAAKQYGNSYGFKCTGSGTNIKDTKLINHLKNGGTAVVNVYNHYIAIVGYDANTKKYQVFDCAPGVGRKTTAKGDWWKYDYFYSSDNMYYDSYKGKWVYSMIPSRYWMYAKK